MEALVVIIVVVISVLTIVALSGCTAGGVVKEEIMPGHYARVCDGPDPAHVAAWHADLRKSGTSALPMPLPNCEDVWIPPLMKTRPANWGDRWGVSFEPGLPLSYEPACGGPATDYQTGVVFCARDNDRDRDRDRSDESASTASGAGVSASDDDRSGTETPGDNDAPPDRPDAPPAGQGGGMMMGPGD